MERRSIGLYEGIALYIAAILGSGVLFLSGVTASIAGPAFVVALYAGYMLFQKKFLSLTEEHSHYYTKHK